jgi:hypothetical protein
MFISEPLVISFASNKTQTYGRLDWPCPLPATHLGCCTLYRLRWGLWTGVSGTINIGSIRRFLRSRTRAACTHHAATICLCNFQRLKSRLICQIGFTRY